MRPLSVKRVFKSSSPQKRYCTVPTCFIRLTWFISLVETQRLLLVWEICSTSWQRLRSIDLVAWPVVICPNDEHCTPMSPVAHVASVPSAGSRVHPREGEESREEAGRKPIWPRRLEHTDSWSTGLVTQGCIPLCLGGKRGSLTAHLM